MSSQTPRRLPNLGLWLALFLALAALGLRLRGSVDLSRQGFDALFTGGAGFLGLAAFLLLVGRARSGAGLAPGPERPAVRAWLAGFLVVLAVALVGLLVVDPYSRLGARPFPRLIVPLSTQLDAYRDLAEPPQVVIFGSSRAQTVSPATIREGLGVPVFNFAVQGASTEYPLLFTRYMQAQGVAPQVLFVEVAPALDRGEEAVAERTLPAFFPYMPPDLVLLTLEQDWSAMFNIHALSDAAFLAVRQAWMGVPQEEVSFDSSGMMTNLQFDVDQESLLQSVETVFANAPRCTELDPAGLEDIQELIDIAVAQDTAIVFYQSPRHPLLVERLMADPEYVRCQAAFEQAMQAFDAAYPNVFFLPYLQLDPASRLDLAGFYDAQHLTYLGADAVVDAALPTLQEALDWSTSRRSAP
jgi:hypothetical protein